MARACVAAVATTLVALLAVAIAAAAGASVCNTARCGKGRCIEMPGPHPFQSFTCACDPGWSTPETWLAPAILPMPCVVPNCSFSKTCWNLVVPPSPDTPFDQCYSVNCGPGGECVEGAGVGYTCRCKPGFQNMLNDTSMPCIDVIGGSCTFGADCAKLGLVNTAAAPAPTPVVGNDLY